tara:strand:- start:85 stop:351 length:267 start_codon:yes stop_codon:yes gene_type:complete
MKNLYVLTVHDSKIKGFIVTQHYSNLKAGKESFQSIKNHLIKKHNLNSDGFKLWTLGDNGANRTEVYKELYNISLTKQTLQKETSTWI